jgi:hypothetical protein
MLMAVDAAFRAENPPAKMRARGKGGAVSASVIQPGRAPAQLAICFEGRCTRAHIHARMLNPKIQPRMPERWHIGSVLSEIIKICSRT